MIRCRTGVIRVLSALRDAGCAGKYRECKVMPRQRIAVIMGTRPEAIKLGPVVHELKARDQEFETVVVATAQHRQMLDQVLSLFGISPDVDLDLMSPNQDLSDLTARVLKMVKPVLQEVRPDLLIVQGDTTTVFATALAAFYLGQSVAHVEAGLRSHDNQNPFPEEVNRRLATVLTDVHLAPTALAFQELVREGVARDRIVITGNTVVDALANHLTRSSALVGAGLEHIPFDSHRILLATSHRRESLGEDLENICFALRDLVERVPDLAVVYPVHLNPNVSRTVKDILGGVDRVYLTPPLGYEAFLYLMRRAYLILTDSGGVQEEAPALHKPVLVLRQVTERPEASLAGMSKIVGISREVIVAQAIKLLTDRAAYHAMTTGENPYGDGRAAERIVDVISQRLRGQYPLLAPECWFQAPTVGDHVMQAGLFHGRLRLGEMLLRQELITEKQLEDALMRQREVKVPQLGNILKEMGALRESDLQAALLSVNHDTSGGPHGGLQSAKHGPH
ncbi:MAG: UDP-N-acetylglucosamine 2-epimerase (non-hydrolyzing) [Pseudomonadota bacterium]